VNASVWRWSRREVGGRASNGGGEDLVFYPWRLWMPFLFRSGHNVVLCCNRRGWRARMRGIGRSGIRLAPEEWTSLN
jgi:hypothetical protein